MEDEVDIRISPALHPTTIKSLDGYNEDTKGYVALVETAFSEAYQGIQSVHDAKAAGAHNPAMNDAAKLLQVDDFANRKMGKITRSFDAARTKLEQGIGVIEGELRVPVKEKASSAISAEIRSHVKGMSVGERQQFIQARIAAGDEETVSAVLGGPSYLSGLNDQMSGVLLRQWHAKQQPAKAAQLKVMLAAKDKIERDAGKVFTAMADAVGCIEETKIGQDGFSKVTRRIYAADLRKARDAAEKPFAA